VFVLVGLEGGYGRAILVSVWLWMGFSAVCRMALGVWLVRIEDVD
jgi:hypothetical protein